MEILLGNDNYFVEGAKNAAIYSLGNGKVYALNESGKNTIIKYVKNKQLNESEQDFIQKLISKKIIESVQISQNIEIKKLDCKINFAWLELTGNCNLKCIHCYGSFGCPKTESVNNLNKKEWFNVINQLYDNGCRNVQLIGGEPCCCSYYNEIIEYLRKKGFNQITIFTNATLLNEKNVETLRENKVDVRFSLYGYDAISHEKITQVKGSFEKTIKAIKLLKENNVRVGVAIILMKENQDEIEKIRRFVIEELKIEYSGFDVIRPSCVNDNLEHRVTNYDLLSKRYYTMPKFKITKTQFIKNHYYNPCWNSKIAITANGDIIPCIFARDFVIGNIREKTLEQLKENINNLWEITKNDIDQCKDCEFKYACSDCRPLAVGINQEKNSKYPRCCYSPLEGKWKNIREVTKEIIK